ncbi:unnamed protein product [Paramecium pentaurelia]|uniref:t-SNARE coiled-coil homology domain-containing protein n=1 Tax=Paramecium pentaurelia TaxID=43138 RepID=A0A8S1TGZ9_9CILI|nr:unnamed protein product [Paramecium pentaurelia]
MSELEQNLLSNSIGIKTQFQHEIEKIIELIDNLKQINDQIQSTQISDQQSSNLLLIKQTFKIKADNIKQIVTSLEKSVRGNEQRNILNKQKQSYQKEVERQKRILKSFINSSFEKRFSRISIIRQSKAIGQETQTEQLKYFVDQNYVRIVPKDERKKEERESKQYSSVYAEENSRVKAISIDEEFLERDMIDLENMLIDERQKELDEIEKEAFQLNQIANQMGSTVDQLEVQLDIGKSNISLAKTNVIATSKELVSVDVQQKRLFKKKYYFIIGVLILAIVVLIILLILIN